MTTDLACLVLTALWGWCLVTFEVIAKTRVAGRAWNLGNRDQEPEFPAWLNRTGRAIANHKENFPLFLTAVVVTQLAHRADGVTAAASAVYLVARVAHAVLYAGGITGARSAAHIVSLVAVLAILSRLVLGGG
jgi:uncharacterized MAPEG superfamily protein